MNVVVAPDSFKESMSALVAAKAMARGVRRVWRDADVVSTPMADGGEGTLDALLASGSYDLVETEARDARQRWRTARFGWNEATGHAFLESAEAIGIERISTRDRDVWRSTSVGLGDLVLAALDRGARTLTIALGGSATNDGGAGMLTALGGQLTGADGAPLDPTPTGLRDLQTVDLHGLDPRLTSIPVEVALDVDTPLLGERGATAVFGPQKGVRQKDISELDALLARLAELVTCAQGSLDLHADLPGGGAAGGLGWMTMRILHATPRRGVEVVAEAVGLARSLAAADLVLTGEGSVDAQTLAGKTVDGVVSMAQSAGVPALVFAGRVDEGARALLDGGARMVISITPEGMTREEALRDGPVNLERCVEETLREWNNLDGH